MNNIELGKKLRDKVSGFAGIASTRTHFMTGNIQFNLTTKLGEDGLYKDGAFDIHQLEFVSDEGITVIESPIETGIELGEEVEDIVTGTKGIATLKTVFLNGCVYYTICTKDEKDPKDMFVEYRRLIRVGPGVTKQIAERTEATPKKTGGPAFKVPMRG